MSSPRRYKRDVSGTEPNISDALNRVAGNIHQHDRSRIELAIVGYGKNTMSVARIGGIWWIGNDHWSKGVATG